jgi:hypothetical protein
MKKKPAPHDEYLKYLPAEHREAVTKKLDDDWADREVFEDKQEVAAQIDKDRAVRVTTERLQRHERDLAAARRRPRGRSRRTVRQKKFADRKRKLYKRMRAHIEKYAAKLRALGQNDADPIPVPPEVWRAGQLIMADPTGDCGRIALAGLPPAIARRTRNAALHPKPYHPSRKREGRTLRVPQRTTLEGRRRYWSAPGTRTWDHPAAIRTIAAAVVLFKLGHRTRRSGFKRVVRGIPRRMICALLADPNTGARPSLSTVYGNKDGTPGDVRALAEAGLILIDQPPGAKVEPCDRGPSGFAFNTYWFYPWLPREPHDPDDDEPDEIAELAAAGLRIELGLETPAGPDPPDRLNQAA